MDMSFDLHKARFNPYEITKNQAIANLKAQKINPEDFVGPDDILICGRCGEPKQEYAEIPNPSIEEPDRKSLVKMVRKCKCDKEAEEEEKKKKAIAELKASIPQLRRASLMDEKFKQASFASYVSNKENERALNICRRYAAQFPEMIKRNQGLLFWGNVGTGKSYSAACIGNHLLAQGIPVMMVSLSKLVDMMQKEGFSEYDIISRMNSAKLVIFDDLGAERNTPFSMEKIYNIIDGRWRKNLPMIVTTNLTIKEMKEETDIRYRRIYDRIFEVCYPVQFTGSSWRRKEAAERFYSMKELLDFDEEKGKSK